MGRSTDCTDTRPRILLPWVHRYAHTTIPNPSNNHQLARLSLQNSSSSPLYPNTETRLTPSTRHPHARPPVPQRRHLRQINPPLVARNLHLPTRILSIITAHSPTPLHPRRRPPPLPRHHNSSLLRHDPRPSNQSAVLDLPGKRPARARRAGLHGPARAGVLS